MYEVVKAAVLKFSFQGYRNLHEGTLLPHAGTNVIFGKNAQGQNQSAGSHVAVYGRAFLPGGQGCGAGGVRGAVLQPANGFFQPGKGTICKTFFTKRPPAGRIKWSEETFGRVPGGEILRGCVFPGPFVSGQGWPRRAPGIPGRRTVPEPSRLCQGILFISAGPSSSGTPCSRISPAIGNCSPPWKSGTRKLPLRGGFDLAAAGISAKAFGGGAGSLPRHFQAEGKRSA